MLYCVTYEIFTVRCFTTRQEMRFHTEQERAAFLAELAHYNNLFSLHTYTLDPVTLKVTNYQ